MGDMRYQTRTNRDPVHVEAESLSFSMYSAEEVQQTAAAEINIIYNIY